MAHWSVVPGDPLLGSYDIHTPSDDKRGLLAPEEADTIQWACEFLSKAEPRLPHAGSVCPFTPKTLNLDRFYTATFPSVASASDVHHVMEHFCRVFRRLDAADGPDARYRSLAVIFPNVPRELAADIIDANQRELKPLFVENLLMIGEFHPRCPTLAIGTTDLYAFQSPYPMLAVRVIVDIDWPKFLLFPGQPQLQRFEWMRSWLRAQLLWSPDAALRGQKGEVLRAQLQVVEEMIEAFQGA